MKTEVEFIEDGHIYLNGDGVIIPSVSELIRFKFPDQYKGVPEKVLKAKARYGSKAHDYIERFVNKEFTIDELRERNIDPDYKLAVEQFEYHRKNWAFQVKSMEEIVTYKGRYAGKYDILTIDDLLIDLKTTSEIHEEWLSWQLGLYYTCLGINRDFGYVLWLPKGKMGEVRQINVKTHDECIELLEDYEKHTSGK